MLAASLLPANVEHTDENILKAMERLRYPVLATLKLDGIRAIKLNDLVSRTLKLIPNKSIRARAMKLPAGFDMELWNPELPYDQVESIVMSREHADSDKIQFHILDWIGVPQNMGMQSYAGRCAVIDGQFKNYTIWDMHFQYPIEWSSPLSLFNYFTQIEYEHGEGICFRTPNSPYKQGRSTLKEQYLVKLARYIRQEVTIIGMEEQMENANLTSHNAIGMMDRSSCKANLYHKDTLGSFLVRDKNKQTFSVGTGTGLTDTLRKEIWNNRDKWIGKQITIKHKPHGQKIKPRSPIAIMDSVVEFVGKREKGF
jgi:DNA ligase-1